MKNFVSWFRSLLVFLLPAIALGVIVGAVPGYMAYDYTWRDAQFCTSCHVHDYATEGWKNSVHGQKTTCHDCHHQPLRAYLRESWIMLTRHPKFPKDLDHTPYVKNHLCEACHRSEGMDQSTLTGPLSIDEIKKLPKIDQTWLHKKHLSKTTQLVLENKLEIPESERLEKPIPHKTINREKGPARPIACADCHGGSANRGHHFGAVDRACVRCHDTQHHPTTMNQFGCRSCHFQDFLIKK